MTTEENKALVRRLVEEGFNGGDESVFGTLLAADYVQHDPANPTVTDRDTLKQSDRALHDAFSDYQVTIEDLVAEGDRVVARWTWRGTQTGTFQGIPPTGKAVTLDGLTMHRISNGTIQESWWGYDFLSGLQQLGINPSQTPIPGQWPIVFSGIGPSPLIGNGGKKGP